MKIKSITQIGNEISIITDNKEKATFYPFSAHEDVYTTTSPGLYKHQLKQFKKDIVKSEWNVQQLKEWYL